jgi:hypothetical protein
MLLYLLLYLININTIDTTIECSYEADSYDKNFNNIAYNLCKDYYSCYDSYMSLINMNGTEYVCYILIEECCFDIIYENDGSFMSFSLDADNKIINNTIFHSSSFAIGFYIQCLRRLKDGVSLFCITDSLL